MCAYSFVRVLTLFFCIFQAGCFLDHSIELPSFILFVILVKGFRSRTLGSFSDFNLYGKCFVMSNSYFHTFRVLVFWHFYVALRLQLLLGEEFTSIYFCHWFQRHLTPTAIWRMKCSVLHLKMCADIKM